MTGEGAARIEFDVDQRYYHELAPGDIVTVTDSFARDPLSGERGISERASRSSRSSPATIPSTGNASSACVPPSASTNVPLHVPGASACCATGCGVDVIGGVIVQQAGGAVLERLSASAAESAGALLRCGAVNADGVSALECVGVNELDARVPLHRPARSTRP